MSKNKFVSTYLRSPLIKILAWLTRFIVSLFSMTLRIKINNKEEFKTIHDIAKNRSLMIAIWHNRLLLIAPILRKTLPNLRYSVLISKSRDGDIPNAFAKTYRNVDVIRVAHSNRHSALRNTLNALGNGRAIIITPDGPRGPCYSIKPGVIFSAQKSNSPVFALTWTPSKCWRLKSWDGLIIPYPFSKIEVTLQPPLKFEDGCNLEEASNSLKKSLSR